MSLPIYSRDERVSDLNPQHSRTDYVQFSEMTGGGAHVRRRSHRLAWSVGRYYVLMFSPLHFHKGVLYPETELSGRPDC